MLFFVDEANSIKLDYVDLLNKISNKKILYKYIYTSNIEDVLIDIVASLYYACDIELLDGDFSNEELTLLNVSIEDLNIAYPLINKTRNINIDKLLETINENKDNIKIGIYSSGTTGMPKRFEHSLTSLLRNIKVSEKHSYDIWGFAYNITHFAGLQVFLQALMNKNTVVNLFNDNMNNANYLLEKYKCTCLSATPTFYRNFVFNRKSVNKFIKYITFGGEGFDNNLLSKAKEKFPKAKIRNIYASTEIGSLLAGNDDSFKIPRHLENLIKISDENHLLVHKSLLNSDLKLDWYDTKDIVHFNDDGSFKILNRDSDFINVGGYKVNPLEVEGEILKIQGVLDVVVTSRRNSVLGRILVANIKKDSLYSEIELKKIIMQDLKNKLQSFKIPRLINFVDDIERNRSGKKVRA